MSGGIRVAAIYARELVRLGHTVHLVSPQAPTRTMRTKLRDVLRGRSWWDRPPTGSHLDHGDFNHRVLNHPGPVTNKDLPDADVVIATWWETAEWVASLGPQKGAKVYFIQHHEIFPYLPFERCRATYRLPLHKIVVAKWLKDVMETEYGDFDVDLVPNAVDHSQFFAPTRAKQTPPTVGFLYSRVPFKGLDITLAALKRVRQLLPDARLLSFGSDASGADQLPVGTEFVLSPAQHAIRDIYSRCDVWVTASSSEGFNLPAMEAMACRTPVVSTRTGWPAEAIVQGENGFLVDVNDVEGLADSILKVLSCSEQRWSELSRCAYEAVAASSWENSAAAFEAALRRAVQVSRGASMTRRRTF
ncbi:glycosyltransferase family 4 protein [Bradyrhizobium campsiandrae]|nr:glycosyltransferase family 4 protein [Bradyrhizobium campsiandrae]